MQAAFEKIVWPGKVWLKLARSASVADTFGRLKIRVTPGEIAVFRPSAHQAMHYELVSRVSLPDLAAYHAAVRRRSD